MSVAPPFSEVSRALDGLAEMYTEINETQTAPILLDHIGGHRVEDVPIGEITLRNIIIPHLPTGCYICPVFRIEESGRIQLLAATLTRLPSLSIAKESTPQEPEESEETDPKPYVEEEKPEDLLI